MTFRVLYDANAVFGPLQRSILVRVGVAQARFNLRVLLTERILDEMVGHVSKKYPDFTDLFDLDQAAMRQLVSDEAAARGIAFDQVVELLEKRGMIRLAQHLRR